MHISAVVIVSMLASTTIAAPVPLLAPDSGAGNVENLRTPTNSKDTTPKSNRITTLPNPQPRTPALIERQGACVVDICQQLFDDCVKTCSSLTDGECFDGETNPNCEGCAVDVAWCPSSE